MGFETVEAKLDEMDLIKSRSYDDTISALCPGHEDNTASLSLREGDAGKALLFCHAGCDIRDVVEALDLSMSDLFQGSDSGAVVATYVYQDEEGQPLYRVMRLSPKGFYQERWTEDGWTMGLAETRRVLYHLPELVAAGHDTTVYLCEGEKDVDALRRLGLLATTLLGGAGKWREEYSDVFRGRAVSIVADADDPGREGAAKVRAALDGVAASVEVLYPAYGKDVSDHLNSGLELGDLLVDNGGLDEFAPMDWETWEDQEIEWLVEPYIPRQGRVLAFGSAGSLKSLWAMWVAARLAREGKRVAYFALEMLPGDIASRMRSLNPPRENFLMFTNLRLGQPGHTERLMKGLKGFDLIVIDSWSAARAHVRYEGNEEVAALDSETLLPLIKMTGASVVLIDNTGHDAITNDGKVKADHARGASAKGDKMEVALWFHRPFEDNNYRTTIEVKKMRLNYPAPSSLTIETPQEEIEFYHVSSGIRTMTSMWEVKEVEDAVEATTETTAPVSEISEAQERRALARLKDKFKAVETDAVSAPAADV